MYSNKRNINILTSLLVEFGVKHVVVCPGSRNAPLVHNFNECPDITCHPATDERSAGFIALGLRLRSKQPVAVCVTSGSALLNTLPAVAEASYQQQGIIVISADRPAAWIDQLDGQTMPQPDALGKFVTKSVNLPEIPDSLDNETRKTQHWYCNRLINEAFIAYQQPEHPSVHINVPITEPLFEFNVQELPKERLIRYGNWDDSEIKETIIELINAKQRPVFVIGQTSNNALPVNWLRHLAEHFVVLTEPLSGGNLPQSFTDQMLYSIARCKDSYRPDLIIYIGGHTVSKRLRQFLRSFEHGTTQVLFSEDNTLRDVSMLTNYFVTGNYTEIIQYIDMICTRKPSNRGFYNKWQDLRRKIALHHDNFKPAYSQMLAVKLFEESVPENNGDEFYYGNSMSVRLASLYAKHYCHCNRGLNGIEGSLSVAAGASLDQKFSQKVGNTFCIIGDLSFFYDENALWQQELGGNFRIMLLNNGQGGIFRNLKGLEQSPVRDSYVSARHNSSAEGICKQFNVKYFKATDDASLNEGLKHLINDENEKPLLLEVMTDVNIDEQQFKEYFHNLKK